MNYFNRRHRRIWLAIFFFPSIGLVAFALWFSILTSSPLTMYLSSIGGILIGLAFIPNLLCLLMSIFEPDYFEKYRDDQKDKEII